MDPSASKEPVIKDRRVKVTPEQREEIIRRRAAGERLIALAEEFGISRQRVDMIAKRLKQVTFNNATKRPLTAEQLAWLDHKLTSTKRKYKIDTVEKMVYEQFKVRMAIQAHTLWLIDRGVIFSDSDTTISFASDFGEYVHSERARQIREKEAIWAEEQKKLKPKMGRPRKAPEATAAPSATPKDPEIDSDDDDDSDEEWLGETLSVEEMLASVQQTRRQIALKSGAKGLTPQKRPVKAPGVRVGKHAKATQPSSKNKKRKKKR